MEREKIIDRVRKLLAKSNGTENEAEAAVFAAKAHSMMTEHALSQDEIEAGDDSAPGIVKHRFSVGRKTYPTIRTLSEAVTRYYLCRCYFVRYGRNMDYVFVGRESRVMVAEMMFRYLVKTTYRLARPYFDVDCATGDSFVRGCMTSLSARLFDMTARAKKPGQPGDKSGLPALYDQAEEEIRSIFEGMKTISAPVNGGAAFYSGAQAGNSVSLNEQVGADKKTTHLAIAAR